MGRSLRFQRAIAGLSVAVAFGPVLIYVFASVTDRIRTPGDAARALGMCFVAEVVAVLIAGPVVTQLKGAVGEAPDATLRRSIRVSLSVARLAFWSSVLLLLLLPLAAAFFVAIGIGVSG
jgi:hypothetical protein